MVTPVLSSQDETGLAFKSQNYINALEIEQNKIQEYYHCCSSGVHWVNDLASNSRFDINV